jgi:recombination protein RecA
MTNEDDMSKADRELAEAALIEPDPPVDGWISTGCTQLDLAIADRLPGGFPVGRTIELLGGASSCKTVIGMTAIGATQRSGGIGYFFDVEDTFDCDWSKMYGLDLSNTDTLRVVGGADSDLSTVEGLFDDHLKLILKNKDDRKKLAVIDSVSALSCKPEMAGDLEKLTMRDKIYKAAQMSAAMRKYNPTALSKGKLSLLFISQTRDNVGVVYGPSETTSGGRALEFYASVRIQLWTSSKILDGNDEVVGVWIRFEVVKNKVGPPFRKGMFRIMFNYGLDDIYSNLDYLKKFQDIEKKKEAAKEKAKAKKKGKAVKDDEDKKSRLVDFNKQTKTLKTMVKYVEDNNLEQKLKDEVAKVWRKLHPPSDRKTRVW